MKATQRSKTDVVSDWLYNQLNDTSLTKTEKAAMCNRASRHIGNNNVWDVIIRVSDEHVARSERIVEEKLEAHNARQQELYFANISPCDECGTTHGCID
jgi:hypothetical protein